MALYIRGLLRPGVPLRPCLTRLCSSENAVQTSTAKSDAVATSDSTTEADDILSKIEIELRAHQPEVLESYNWFATTAAKHLEVTVDKAWADKDPHKLRKTLLRSVFSQSKHRVQYEMRTHYSFIHLKNLTGSTASTYLEYIQRNLPEGVAMKVTKHKRKPMLKFKS